jgi:hypothetical protein
MLTPQFHGKYKNQPDKTHASQVLGHKGSPRESDDCEYQIVTLFSDSSPQAISETSRPWSQLAKYPGYSSKLHGERLSQPLDLDAALKIVGPHVSVVSALP